MLCIPKINKGTQYSLSHLCESVIYICLYFIQIYIIFSELRKIRNLLSILPTLPGREGQQTKHDYFYFEFQELGGCQFFSRSDRLSKFFCLPCRKITKQLIAHEFKVLLRPWIASFYGVHTMRERFR
ncbi:hypothetical protein SAMN05216357_11910 [Porphyromonadaceae bacterium KH3CP3RA]|nr:hypothetical protein SAMN05216357_11910 [Porphyromonadaceae bacterium KH3CP3RA]